jgi:class 3 adenylate cyclase
MMKMMHQYSADLELRTQMLADTQRRADHLLNQMMPPAVAAMLKAGHNVPPKTYESATVLFTDIVSFTAMCSQSTPMNVVTLLNVVFTNFDGIVTKHDAYKVETIGDAYMIASGIPTENGLRHVHELAEIGLAIVETVAHTAVAHMPPDYRLRVRVGMCTGPVATGVIGLVAPRFCLFGDTVNTASRMESTGVPMRVHMSESSAVVLIASDEWICEQRGSVAVKGKDAMKTYWLIGPIGKVIDL